MRSVLERCDELLEKLLEVGSKVSRCGESADAPGRVTISRISIVGLVGAGWDLAPAVQLCTHSSSRRNPSPCEAEGDRLRQSLHLVPRTSSRRAPLATPRVRRPIKEVPAPVPLRP